MFSKYYFPPKGTRVPWRNSRSRVGIIHDKPGTSCPIKMGSCLNLVGLWQKGLGGSGVPKATLPGFMICKNDSQDLSHYS